MIGETFGAYKIVSELGRGGMGIVYLAEHRHLPRKAAIKVLLRELTESREVLDRFFAEARASALIEHPGIVSVLDCDVHPSGNPFIVMECLEGKSLKAELELRGRLPAHEAARVGRQIARAIEAAHARDIVHRDLKPENVFLVGGDTSRVKILDFGIAKLGAGASWKTQTGALLGTPLYMSPEQCRGGAIDWRTDIYSLGCILYELLAGQPPFLKETPVLVLGAHLYEAPPALTERAPDAPPALLALVARALAKAPEERPQTMAALAAALDPFAEAPVAAGADGAEVIDGATARGGTTGPRDGAEAHESVTVAAAGTTFGQSAGETVPGLEELPRSRSRGRLLVACVMAAGVGAAALAVWRGGARETTAMRTEAAGRLARPTPDGPAQRAAGAAASASRFKETDEGDRRASPAARARAIAARSGGPAIEGSRPAPTRGSERKVPANDDAAGAPRTAEPAAGSLRAPAAAEAVAPPPSDAPAVGASLAPPPLGAPEPPSRPAGRPARGAARARARAEAPAALRTIVVETDPPGARLCAQGEPRPLGVAGALIEVPKTKRKTRLLVYYPGFRVAELVVPGDRNVTERIALRPLTAEDLQDPPPCR